MKKRPFIDIIVPTYNRPEDIERFVEEIQKQEYTSFKVFVIDDHGSEKIEHLIPTKNPAFIFERLEQNKGQAFARNHALAKGLGDIIVFMDDDAWFLETNSLNTIANYFEDNKFQLGCLMFDVLEPNREWLHERKKLRDSQEIGEFIACGCAFERQSIEAIGGFSDFLHSYGEETDITLKLIKKERKVIFGDKVKLFHNFQPGERDVNWLKRFKHNSARNDLLIVIMRFPFLYVLPYFVSKFFSHIYYNFKHEKKYFLANFQVIKGLLSALVMLPKALKRRDAVSIAQFKHWKKVRF